MTTFSVAETIRDDVARHVPASVLANANVRILGTGADPLRGVWYGLTLAYDAEEDCVYAEYWLPEEGETGQLSYSIWRNGVESARRLEWVE